MMYLRRVRTMSTKDSKLLWKLATVQQLERKCSIRQYSDPECNLFANQVTKPCILEMTLAAFRAVYYD